MVMTTEQLKDRPSTRVHHAPGGNSSMSGIFGSSAATSAPPPSASSAAPAAPKDGNAAAPAPNGGAAAGQRVALRTEHTGISAHSSTRVHAGPGGNSTFNIFNTNSTVAQAAPVRAGAPAPINTSAPVEAAPAAGQRVAQRTEHTGISEHSSTRVHAQPGGNSSFVFGTAANVVANATPMVQPTAAGTPPVAAMAPPAAQAGAAGQRVSVRTEHLGMSDLPSTRVHAAPGGRSEMGAILAGGVTANDRIAALKARRQQTGASEPLSDATNNSAATH